MSLADGDHREKAHNFKLVKVRLKDARIYDMALAKVEETAEGEDLEDIKKARARLARFIESGGKK